MGDVREVVERKGPQPRRGREGTGRPLPSRIDKRIWAALIVVYIVWGSTYLAIRVADRTIPPFLMAGVRFLVAGSLLFAWSIRRGKERDDDPLGRRQWLAATVVGGLLLAGGNGAVVWAETRTDSGVVALIIATVPIWMAVMTAVRDRRGVALRVIAGLVIGFGGTALLVRATEARTGHAEGAALAVVFGGAMCWALGSVLSQRVPLPKRPFVATGMEMIAGGGLLFVVSLITGEVWRFHPGAVSMQSLAGMLYLITIGSWAGFSAYVWLLKHATTSLASTYAFVNPVIAVVLGWAILGETVTGATLAAAALVVGAVALIVKGQDRGRPRMIEPAAASTADAPPVRREATG
jgi:drug/metabolite transporter (DMT)-like permease